MDFLKYQILSQLAQFSEVLPLDHMDENNTENYVDQLFGVSWLNSTSKTALRDNSTTVALSLRPQGRSKMNLTKCVKKRTHFYLRAVQELNYLP